MHSDIAGVACIQLTHPSTGKALCKAPITHMLSFRFYTILHMVWGRSPCLSSYFLIITLDVEVNFATSLVLLPHAPLSLPSNLVSCADEVPGNTVGPCQLF